MGDILGGIFGAAGDFYAADQAADAQKYAADKAAATARLGFDWLKDSPEFTGYLKQGSKANNNIASLLMGGASPEALAAFDAYKGSTGFQNRLQTGADAITGNQAARGILNSGATGKRLTQYGQELGSGEFANYLSQLGALANTGLAAGQTIGSAGSAAGASGAGAIANGYGAAANAQSAGLNNALGSLGYAANSAFDKWWGGGSKAGGSMWGGSGGWGG